MPDLPQKQEAGVPCRAQGSGVVCGVLHFHLCSAVVSLCGSGQTTYSFSASASVSIQFPYFPGELKRSFVTCKADCKASASLQHLLPYFWRCLLERWQLWKPKERERRKHLGSASSAAALGSTKGCRKKSSHPSDLSVTFPTPALLIPL